MGNCSCIHGTHDDKQIEAERNFGGSDKSIRKSIECSSRKHSDLSKKVVTTPSDNIGDLIKLQALLKGYIDRKKVAKTYANADIVKPSHMNNDDNKSINSKDLSEIMIYRKEVSEIPLNMIPDYSGPSIKSIRIRLGDFIYSSIIEPADNVIKRGPVMIENSSIYTGD